MRGRASRKSLTAVPASRARRVAYRVCVVGFALFWLTIGFGIIDLASGFASGPTDDSDGTGVLSAAYGVIAAIVLPAALLAQLRGLSRRVAALQQLAAVAVAFAAAGLLAFDPLSFISVATLGLMLAVLWKLIPPRLPAWPPRVASSRLLALAAIAAVPWLLHAFEMAANGRAGLSPDDSAARPQAGGWAAAAALALLIILLAMLASTKAPGWRVPALSAAAAAVVFGLVSILNPNAPASVGAIWGVLAIAWSTLVVATAVLERSDDPLDRTC